MNRMYSQISGLITVALIATLFSIGGHTVFGSFSSMNDTEHHAIEHELDITADTIAAAHSDESDCHGTDPQLISSLSTTNLKVIISHVIYSYFETETQHYSNVILSSQRDKIPLFEMAKIHTSTLTLRV
ncbi:hypothetical protein COU75_04240 [Candidatus Peregrinibacteria bacterium CG10_big_fil_rev_8_21_14_0_10_42_8]|nr:MAG: hypothetical protein COU75_04240 [Candidatus Peregrinibacteria bacterium CG10_big_fil_rev_8_21_14_0_10_42_8]